MRSTKSQNERNKRHPMAAFGNAGIEPSKNKVRQGSISQVHVFKEARTQAKAPITQKRNPSSSSMLMTSFLKGPSVAIADTATNSTVAPMKPISSKQTVGGGKRDREEEASGTMKDNKKLSLSQSRTSTGTSFVKGKSENVLNRSTDYGDDDIDDDVFDLDKIVDESYCDHQRRYNKQQLQLIQLQKEQSGQDPQRSAPSSSSIVEALPQDTSQCLLSGQGDGNPGEYEQGQQQTESNLGLEGSRNSRRTNEPLDEGEEVERDIVINDEADKAETVNKRIPTSEERDIETVYDMLVKRSRSSKTDGERRVLWRPHSFIKDPRQYSRYPFSHLNAPFAQQMFERLAFKRMGVRNPTSSMPRRVAYCGNGEVNPRYGVNRVVFDPCGTHYAVCGSNGVVRIHDFDISEANLLHGKPASEESGGPNDCLLSSVNTKRSVSDLAWSNRDDEDVIAVVFAAFSEVWVYDLQNVRARSEPNMKIKCQDGGNRVVLFDTPSGDTRDKEDFIIAGSSSGVVRKFSVPRPNGKLELARYSKRWEVHADPQKKTERAGVVGLVYPVPRTTARFRGRKDHSLDHDDVLVSITEQGALTLWDTKNLVTANFGSSGQPSVLATLNLKSTLSLSVRSNVVVGLECVDMSIGRTGVKESSWQPSRVCACTVAVTFSSGSVHFFDLCFETTARRERGFIERRKAKTEARKSNFTSGMSNISTSDLRVRKQQEQEEEQRQAARNSIRQSTVYGSVIAEPKFSPPSTNVGASIQLNGGLLQEITEERLVAEQVLRNNKFNTPPCVSRWAGHSLQVFSSFPHYHADLQNPLHYIIATEFRRSDAGTLVQDNKSGAAMMLRTNTLSFCMPGHVVEAVPGQREIIVSHDLRPFFAGHTVGPDTGGSTGARIQFDSTGRNGPQRVSALMSGQRLPVHDDGAPSLGDFSSLVTSYNVNWAESRSVFLNSPYTGPPIHDSVPFTSMKSTLQPRGGPRRSQQACKSQFQTDIPLRQAPATAMAAHPFLPFIVIGDRDDSVRILSAATVDDTVPARVKYKKEEEEEDPLPCK